MEIGEPRALGRDPQDRTEHPLVDGQDPQIAAGFDGVEEGLDDDLRAPLVPVAPDDRLILTVVDEVDSDAAIGVLRFADRLAGLRPHRPHELVRARRHQVGAAYSG